MESEKNRTCCFNDPQSQAIPVQRVFTDNRDSTVTQRQLKVSMTNSPQSIALRHIGQEMHRGSRMQVQRKMLSGISNAIIQHGDKEKSFSGKNSRQGTTAITTEQVVVPHGRVTQAKTLAQAGRSGGLTESGEDKEIIGGNLGPSSGKAYVQNLGAKETKEQALSASAAAYATIANNNPMPALLSIDLIKDKLFALQTPISDYLGTPAEPTSVEQARLHVRDEIIKPDVVDKLKTDVSNEDLDAILGKLRKVPFTKKSNHTFKGDQQGEKEIKNKFAKLVIGDTWHANTNVKPIDPFLFGAKSRVGGVSDLLLYYQHSPDWPGYVTYVEDGGESSKMRLGGKVSNPETAGVPDTYSNFHHDTGGTNLTGMTGLDSGRTREQNEKSLDAMTKLAGEGARFVCVRSNISRMTDNSRFYVIVDENTTKYVKLSDLWSSWAPVFDKANDISNATVKNAILTSSKWTYDRANDKSARVVIETDQAMGGSDVNLT
jgi:hypothetical protein